MKNYLGLDCGSVSVKLAVINDKKELLDSVYLRNHGLIETIQEGLGKLKEYKIDGVGCTGSGRNFAKILIGADLTKTEVLAHTIGTLNYYPKVRTICDIGGEDSKLMTLNNGVLENFVMNSVCSAGTGSSLESIATRMGIKIEEVGDLALQSKNRIEFPTKCGIFMQSSVVSRLNSGADKSDILMGVCRGMVNNYLTMAKGIKLDSPFVYQGATAKNKAIKKAFEENLNHEIIVPKYCDVMGAIGIGIMTKELNVEKTKFNGYELKDKKYTSKNMIANGCENHCEITKIYEEGKYLGAIGNKCDKCLKDER